jgi:hypothetical protein
MAMIGGRLREIKAAPLYTGMITLMLKDAFSTCATDEPLIRYHS